ncbi:MAG: ATP-binding cassette domain-containing protein [Fervidicoccaceae archaeon]
MTSIVTENLSVEFKSKEILKDVSFTLDNGEIALVYGPTGSGKSTLLKSMSGILQTLYKGFKIKGRILVYGTPPQEILHKGVFSYVPQDSRNFFLGRTISEELRYRGINDLSIPVFENKLDVPIKDLSAGERYRLIAEISFRLGAKIILMDEPGTFLDEYNMKILTENLKEKIVEMEGIAILTDHVQKKSNFMLDKDIALGVDKNKCDNNFTFAFNSMKKYRRGRFEIKGIDVKKGRKLLLKGVSLEVDEGEIVAFTGPNGSGKSSLLREIALLFHKKAKKKEGKRIFYIPEMPLYPFFEETVARELQRWKATEIIEEELTKKLLEVFRLKNKMDVSPFSLSVGESRLLSFISGLIANPDILIIDEPSLGLDYCMKSLLSEIMSVFKSEGGSVLIATHDPHFTSIADKVFEVSKEWGADEI